ncbi:MAG: hypothetical protein U0797_00515 [Gemmataceae bacterium]
MDTNEKQNGNSPETSPTWEWLGAGSRYRLKGNSPSVTVVLGWDRPLSTYFAQVWDVPERAGHHEEGALLLWAGCGWQELPDTNDLVDILEPHAAVPRDLLDVLTADMVATTLGLRPYFELQQMKGN